MDPNICKQCDFIKRSEEVLVIHVKEMHTEKTPQLIEEEEMFELNIKTNFSEIFNTT